MRSQSPREKALRNVLCAAARLHQDSVDLTVWVKEADDAALKAAAVQFASARYTLYRRANALLVAELDREESEVAR